MCEGESADDGVDRVVGKRQPVQVGLVVTTLSMTDILSALADGCRQQLSAPAPAGPDEDVQKRDVGLMREFNVGA